MINTNDVKLKCESISEYLQYRGILSGLKGLKPRSNATARMHLDPDTPVRLLLKLLREYKLLWREGSRADWSQELFLRRENHALRIQFLPGLVMADVISDREDAQGILNRIMAEFRPYAFKNEEPDGIWVSFAQMGSRGVEETTQFLRCPAWEEIKSNYPLPTRTSLEKLLTLREPWKHGRVLIWHGPPGTGKTFAIRALMKAWKDRFSYLVVNDPENLAGTPGYYYQVASESTERPGRRFRRRMWPTEEAEPDNEKPDKPLHRLFILEDSADLILQESRSLHFDKVGKLLNMTDGLFGQGREDLFLITFNEEVTRIDPAFLRPGRCVARVEFGKFPPADAAAWFRTHGEELLAGKDLMTLAELYGKLHGKESPSFPAPQELRPVVGFSTRQ